MKQDVMITIKSLIEANGQEEKIEIITRGKLLYKDGVCFLTYKETEQNGFEGCSVLLKSDGEESFYITRSGNAASQLSIQKGKRNVCSYQTPHTNAFLGITCGHIKRSLNSQGFGEISVGYELDINSELISKNQLFIRIKECKN